MLPTAGAAGTGAGGLGGLQSGGPLNSLPSTAGFKPSVTLASMARNSTPSPVTQVKPSAPTPATAAGIQQLAGPPGIVPKVASTYEAGKSVPEKHGINRPAGTMPSHRFVTLQEIREHRGGPGAAKQSDDTVSAVLAQMAVEKMAARGSGSMGRKSPDYKSRMRRMQARRNGKRAEEETEKQASLGPVLRQAPALLRGAMGAGKAVNSLLGPGTKPVAQQPIAPPLPPPTTPMAPSGGQNMMGKMSIAQRLAHAGVTKRAMDPATMAFLMGGLGLGAGAGALNAPQDRRIEGAMRGTGVAGTTLGGAGLGGMAGSIGGGLTGAMGGMALGALAGSPEAMGAGAIAGGGAGMAGGGLIGAGAGGYAGYQGGKNLFWNGINRPGEDTSAIG